MSPAYVRLTLCSLAFVGWLGYLGWQVLTRPLTPQGTQGTPLVLSRPQLLVAEAVVIAEIPDLESDIQVVEVLRGEGLEEGQELKVDNLKDCRVPLRGDRETPGAPPLDWSGPGRYLVPLQRLGAGEYRVTLIPPSPGYSLSAGPPRIYPATEEARAQFRRITAPPESTW
jgi:hypothetical protein